MGESPISPPDSRRSSSLMDNLLGLLRIRVKRGVNLAVRDVRSSDPYVVIKMGKQVSTLYLISLFFLYLSMFSMFLALYLIWFLKMKII